MVETEVLVVGGGPAGVISAITASKMGMKVILIDAKTYDNIGNKVCGDGLIKSSVLFLKEKIGIIEPNGEELASEFHKMILRIDNTELMIKSEGFTVNRHLYGQRLLKIAEKHGTEVRANTRAIKAIISGEVVKGAIVQNEKGEQYEIFAKVTIDCSGKNYQIRKTLPSKNFPLIEKGMDQRDLAVSYREIIDLDSNKHVYSDSIYLDYRQDIPLGGYFWIFDKGEHMLNVGIGWHLNLKADLGIKKYFRNILEEYYDQGTYKVIEKGGYTIPTRYPLTNAVVSGLITAGDAAFHANPFSAEGHASALIAGYYAGLVSVRAIEKDDTSQENLWDYNKLVLGHFGLMHIKFQIILETLRKLKFKGINFLLKRSILSQDLLIKILSGNEVNFLTKLKICVNGLPRLDILFELSKITKNVKYFEKLINKYPKTPKEYPEWSSKFNSRMHKIRN